MQIGILLIAAAFIAVLFSGWNYYLAIKEQNQTGSNKRKAFRLPKKIKPARIGFYAMTAIVSLASFLLFYQILTHQFQVAYVYQYSSKSLPLGYLISAFWAGQEGSFLLWTLLTAVMGVVLIKTSRQLEAHAMLLMNIVQAFFLAILIKASPFQLLPQIPLDGAGLNPLLQNPWMVIHPPILFVGYAALAYPFALAVASLARREYQQFVPRALPWVLFASATLGAGIIIGGYWAYKVLGWGGYWGWDPVENSSLIPWLTTLALLHGLIAQKIKGLFAKTNFLLTIVSFALALYATFLTRSGVLADFSVHSFQDLGINLYLIAFITAILAIGLGMFFRRIREIDAAAGLTSALNRETIILGTLFIFGLSAFLTFLGTSSPILTGFLGQPGQVDISYYNKIHLPIGIVMALLLGFGPFLGWKAEDANSLLKSILPSLALSIFSIAVSVYFGMANPALLLFTGAAALAFWSNAVAAFRFLKIDWQLAGAPISHVGVALLLAGIIVSARFQEDQRVLLSKNVAQNVLGYQMVYQGVETVANGKDIVKINVSSGNSVYQAEPRFYFNQYNNGVMREPDVNAGLIYDLYISPLERRNPSAKSENSGGLWIKKGQTKKLGEYEILFREFEMADHSEGGLVRVAARLEITRGADKFRVTPAIVYEQNGKLSKSEAFPLKTTNGERNATVILNNLNANEKSIELLFTGLELQEAVSSLPEDQILVEVTKKPFMSVLWMGSILIILGTLIALYRRLPESIISIQNRTKEKKHARYKSVSELSE